MNRFNFDKYEFDAESKTARFYYSYEGGPAFVESYKFDFEFVDFNPEALDRALQTLFLIAGVSYYKAYLPAEISVSGAQIDQKTADFMTKTYQKGLGELFFVNSLPPERKIDFPVNSQGTAENIVESNGLLVGIGGGKDSLVGLELLADAPKLATWSLGHRSQLEGLVKRMGTKHYFVERIIDARLIELNGREGVYNGHVPISAIIASAGTVTAILSGYKDVVVANEYSANEASLEYAGTEINHQYSKTSEFELSYQTLLKSYFGDSIRYYSIIRPLREISVARAFAEHYFAKYKGAFSSCNRAFTQKSSEISWCGECAKCAAAYLLFAPFMEEGELKTLFGGKNLLADPKLEQTYKEILGISAQKPLECVGEIAESRWAMSRMKVRHSELERYVYEEAGRDEIWKTEDNLIPENICKGLALREKFEKLAKKPSI